MESILKYINRISRSSATVYNNKLRDYELNQCQHPYIMVICKEPGISQEKLAREICVNKSNVTRQLSLLEEKGLITRQQDSEDRRVWRVYPTEKMQELLPVVRGVMHELNTYFLEGLSEEEKQILLRILQEIADKANQAACSTLKGKERQP